MLMLAAAATGILVMVMLMLTAAIAAIILAAAVAGMHGQRHKLLKHLTHHFLVGLHDKGQLTLLVLFQASNENLFFAEASGSSSISTT